MRQTIQEILELLAARFKFDHWVLSRIQDDDYIIVSAVDRHNPDVAGSVFKFSDTICKEMIAGNGPQIAPISKAIEAYRNAPVCNFVEINSYMGVPVHLESGELFGTLCAIHSETVAPETLHQLPLLQNYGAMIGRIIDNEIKVRQTELMLREARIQSQTDPLTGIANRAGWDHTCAIESNLSRLMGEYLSVIVLDADGLKSINDSQGHPAGDDYIRRVADCVRQNCRAQDFVARTGGDEFGVLCPGLRDRDVEIVAERIARGLESEGLAASIGYATYNFKGELSETVAAADARMYESKRQRKASVA